MIAIGFDFDHTLGVDNGLERKAMYAYAGELGRPLDPQDALWRVKVDELLATFRARSAIRSSTSSCGRWTTRARCSTHAARAAFRSPY
jgi:phosphoglycolate phosphatase-like HAD superfamily hydrolase